MTEILIHQRERCMGDEDQWKLRLHDSTNAFIKHWWSHRNGTLTQFESGEKEYTLTQFKREFPRYWEKTLELLEANGYKGSLP